MPGYLGRQIVDLDLSSHPASIADHLTRSLDDRQVLSRVDCRYVGTGQHRGRRFRRAGIASQQRVIKRPLRRENVSDHDDALAN